MKKLFKCFMHWLSRERIEREKLKDKCLVYTLVLMLIKQRIRHGEVMTCEIIDECFAIVKKDMER
jgi:hypothetical protein